MSIPKTLIILPAFNEEKNIAQVVKTIRKNVPFADIAVINDGSWDATGQQAENVGAITLHLPYNLGIGSAVQTGFKFATQNNYDIVVRNDGDGQHAAEDITRLIDTLLQSDEEVIIGSRFLGIGENYRPTFARRMGIGLLAQLISIIVGQPVTDPTSGFCAFKKPAIHLFARLYPHDYPEPEAIIILHRCGLHFREIPATMKPREHGKSSITPVRSVYYMIKVILAILISLLRRMPVIQVD